MLVGQIDHRTVDLSSRTAGTLEIPMLPAMAETGYARPYDTGKWKP